MAWTSVGVPVSLPSTLTRRMDVLAGGLLKLSSTRPARMAPPELWAALPPLMSGSVLVGKAAGDVPPPEEADFGSAFLLKRAQPGKARQQTTRTTRQATERTAWPSKSVPKEED